MQVADLPDLLAFDQLDEHAAAAAAADEELSAFCIEIRGGRAPNLILLAHTLQIGSYISAILMKSSDDDTLTVQQLRLALRILN